MKEGIQAAIDHAAIKEYGCYFLDILRWAEIDGGFELTDDDIINIYQKAGGLGIIDADCFVRSAAGLYSMAGGDKGYSAVNTIFGVPDKKTYIICQKKPMYTHFVLWHDGKIWDSLPPDRPGAAGYKPVSFRTLA